MNAPVDLTRAVFSGPHQIRFESRPLPALGPAQVLIEIDAAAVCTWEQRVYAGVDTSCYPLAGGHEYCGRVVRCGERCRGLATGDLVAISHLVRCGTCWVCRR